MNITAKQKVSLIQLSLFALIIITWQFYPYIFPPKEYKFEEGRYTLTMDYENDHPISHKVFNIFIKVKSESVSFYGPLSGDLICKGKILHNKLKINYTSIVNENTHYISHTGKQIKPKQAVLKRTIEFISMGRIDFPVVTYLNFSGKLIGDNFIEGNFSGINMVREKEKGTFLITQKLIKSNKELYPKLPIGNGEGRLMRKFDPRSIEIFFDAEGKVRVDDKVLDFSTLETLAKKQTSEYGSDIPVLLYVDRDVKFGKVRTMVRTLEKAGLYRFSLVYFRCHEWDGMTMFNFKFPPPYPKETTHLKIKCLPDGTLDVKNLPVLESHNTYRSKSGKITLQELIDSLSEGEEYLNVMTLLTVEDDTTIRNLIPLLDFFQKSGIDVQYPSLIPPKGGTPK